MAFNTTPNSHGQPSGQRPPRREPQRPQLRVQRHPPQGQLGGVSNPNGSIHDIAGIYSDNLRVLGMMPHPENHVEEAVGRTDGRGLFAGLTEALEKVA